MDNVFGDSIGALKIGFEMNGKTLRLADILPSRKPDEKLQASRKFATVVASIREVGIIEPPIVHPMGNGPDAKYLLLDGHMRIEALKEIGCDTVFCLISTDDESYTYNNKVNQVTAIQEHFMILKAIERGVSEDRIASALKVDVSFIRQKRNLLQGICPEAVDLLKDVAAGAVTIRKLKKVKPSRQVEIVEMMLMVHNFSSVYCEALIYCAYFADFSNRSEM
ncbi:MAG: plasmid partitioning protein RepB C-terminal domain-containing protein [Armatimonadota bacterium]